MCGPVTQVDVITGKAVVFEGDNGEKIIPVDVPADLKCVVLPRPPPSWLPCASSFATATLPTALAQPCRTYQLWRGYPDLLA